MARKNCHATLCIRILPSASIKDPLRPGPAAVCFTCRLRLPALPRPTQVAIQEVRRLQRFGVTRGELERYKTALLRDRWGRGRRARRPRLPCNVATTRPLR